MGLEVGLVIGALWLVGVILGWTSLAELVEVRTALVSLVRAVGQGRVGALVLLGVGGLWVLPLGAWPLKVGGWVYWGGWLFWVRWVVEYTRWVRFGSRLSIVDVRWGYFYKLFDQEQSFDWSQGGWGG